MSGEQKAWAQNSPNMPKWTKPGFGGSMWMPCDMCDRTVHLCPEAGRDPCHRRTVLSLWPHMFIQINTKHYNCYIEHLTKIILYSMITDNPIYIYTYIIYIIIIYKYIYICIIYIFAAFCFSLCSCKVSGEVSVVHSPWLRIAAGLPTQTVDQCSPHSLSKKKIHFGR
jgi:hypothetical protein